MIMICFLLFWNIIEKYFRMNFLSILSAKNHDLLSLFCIVMAETQFPHESYLFISFRLLLRLLAILSGTLTVENRDVSSANNLGLHWRLWGKSLMYIRNKSSPSIEPWETTALTLAQDELWWLCVTLCFLFLKMPVKRFDKFPEIPLRVTLWIISLYYTLSKTFEMSRNTALTS